MIDDATSELTARFVTHDSTEEEHAPAVELSGAGRSARAFYTDKASLFQTAPKIARDQKGMPRDEREPLPPTQIGRALRELGITWIAAHSPQAKGRVERSFQTAQDRLVKGLRVARSQDVGAGQSLSGNRVPPVVESASEGSAEKSHRCASALDREHDLAASLSLVETRQVTNDYTIRFDSKLYQIARSDIRTGLRGADVRLESRLDGS